MYKTLSISLAALAFLGGFLLFYNSKPVSDQAPGNSLNQNSRQKWETKIDNQSAVTVTVTPTDISPQLKEWKFDVVMDTHTVELDQDMTKVAILVDEQGKEYKALKWEGPTGGHHREGILSFVAIGEYPKRLTLKINDVGEAQRSFSWDLITNN